ncbi:MAG: hypothetical protein ACYSWU_22285 [Planctomycetota bacterium]|jgi:hypothetical protein
MAFKVYNVTLGAAATRATTEHTPITQLIIESETGNADVLVGDSTVAADDYGKTVEAGPAASVTLGGTPHGLMNLDEIYFLGTADDIIHLTVVSP